MTSTLNLAERVQQKSAEQALILERAQNNVLTQLKESMTESLNESKTIINNGIKNLNLSNEQLSEMLSDHTASMRSLMDDTLEQYRTHITQYIETETQEMTQLMTNYTNHMIEMIESYTEHMENLIVQREQALIGLIKSQAKRFWIWVAIGSVLLLIVGAAIGATIASKVAAEPQLLIFKQNPTTGENTFYRGVK